MKLLREFIECVAWAIALVACYLLLLFIHFSI